MCTQKNSIAKSAFFLIGLTIFVKFIGFVKQAVISYTYGTSLDMDIYLIVSSFISEIGVMFFSSLSINLITIYDSEKEKKGKKQSNTLVSNALVTLTVFSLFVVIFVCLFADILAKILAPGFSVDSRYILASYIRGLAFLMVNICISNICIGILNAEKDFLVAKSIGLIQSACIIFACFMLANKVGIIAIYFGFGIYYVFENIFLLICVIKKVGFHPVHPFNDPAIKKVVTLSFPLFLSNAIIEINSMVDKAIASNLDAGSVSSLSYGNFLFQTVHSIIIGSIMTVILSFFSEFVVKKEYEKIISNVRKCSLVLLVILIPITIICLVNSENIVSLIYKRGAFDETSVVTTSKAFVGYTVGIIFIAFRDIFTQILYAFQKTKESMLNGIAGVSINILFSLVLSHTYGVLGIAIADSMAYVIVGAISFFMVIKILPEIRKILSIKEAISFLLAGSLSLLLGIIIKKWFYEVNIYLNMSINIIFSLIMYFAILLFTNNPSLQAIRYLISKRLK